MALLPAQTDIAAAVRESGSFLIARKSIDHRRAGMTPINLADCDRDPWPRTPRGARPAMSYSTPSSHGPRATATVSASLPALGFTIVATVAGCPEISKPDGYCAPGTCPADGGGDGGVGGDASVACGGACGGATPYCKESTNTCVECLQTEQCTDGTKSVCDTSTNTCVACNDNTQCSHIPGKGICDQGMCVGCTEATEAEACGGFYCDPAAKTCTTTPRGTTAFCNECVSDSECANNAEGVRRCVAMGYNGAPRADGKKFCLIDKATLPPSANGICPVQMFDSVNATSVGGVTSAYCSPRQTLTTCEATLDFLKSGGCTDATKCGANLSPTDGMCEDDGNSKQCTYRCLGDDDCATGVKCRTGVTTRYCCTASGVAGCN